MVRAGGDGYAAGGVACSTGVARAQGNMGDDGVGDLRAGGAVQAGQALTGKTASIVPRRGVLPLLNALKTMPIGRDGAREGIATPALRGMWVER
jgi:hypothetical protein